MDPENTLTVANILQLQKPYKETDYDIAAELPTVEQVFNEAQIDIKKARIKNSQAETPIELREPTSSEQKKIIEDSLTRAKDIETAARNPNRWESLQQVAGRIKLIVDFSAPGTYFKPRKKDRYEHLIWAWNMDRIRADLAAIVGIQIAGSKTQHDFSIFSREELLFEFNPELNILRDQVRDSITESGLHFLYLSRSANQDHPADEAEAIRKVIHSPSSFVPPKSVDIRDQGDNTFDQVKALKEYLERNLQTESNPNGFLKPGDASVFVMGQQAIRTFANIAQFNAIPHELQAYILPMSTPQSGFNEYVTMETKGRIVYTMLGQAAQNLARYILLGGS